MKHRCFMSALTCGLSLVLLSGISCCNAKTVVNTERQQTVTSAKAELAATKKLGIKERIQQILAAGAEEPAVKKKVVVSDDTMILGGPVATQEQCVRYLLRNNPHPSLNVSAQELVAYYYEEGNREGVRPDIAFAQALKETGYFRYGGTVEPAQNNYCGLGTTSKTVRGAYFATPQLGVRAHIQHLLAYASTEEPKEAIVDPRYDLVRASYGSSTLPEWKDLNGRWAVPGVGYGQSILKNYYQGILES